MKSYNGFSPQQRQRSFDWLQAQWQAGLPRPRRCMACGQRQGALDAHAEDYSEPFGPHIYAFELCYRCHMMVHCRYRHPAAWAHYRDVIRRGGRFEPLRFRSIRPVLDQCEGISEPEPAWYAPPQRCVLDEIEAGLHDPRRRQGETDAH